MSHELKLCMETRQRGQNILNLVKIMALKVKIFKKRQDMKKLDNK